MQITEFKAVELDTDNYSFYFQTQEHCVEGLKERSQKIEVSEREPIDWNCTCKWGTTWRFNKANEGKTCKHIDYCIYLLTVLGYLEPKNG